MSREKQEQVKSWLKGDLPTWVGVALTSLIAWGGKQAYETLSAAVEELHRHDKRITVLEMRDEIQRRRDGAALYQHTNDLRAVTRHNPRITTEPMGVKQ